MGAFLGNSKSEMILLTDPPMLGGGTQPASSGEQLWLGQWSGFFHGKQRTQQRAGDTRPHSPHPLNLGEAARDRSACLGFTTVKHGFCPGPSFPMREGLENALTR